MKSLWHVIQHIPPLLVTIPYRCMYRFGLSYTHMLEYVALYTFRLQWWLMPECCKAEANKIFSKDSSTANHDG